MSLPMYDAAFHSPILGRFSKMYTCRCASCCLSNHWRITRISDRVNIIQLGYNFFTIVVDIDGIIVYCKPNFGTSILLLLIFDTVIQTVLHIIFSPEKMYHIAKYDKSYARSSTQAELTFVEIKPCMNMLLKLLDQF